MAQNRKFHNGKMAEENAFSPKPDSTEVLCYTSRLSATALVKAGSEGTMEKLNKIFK